MKVTNISAGPRGLHTKDGLILLEKGETRDNVDLESADLKNAKGTGWFSFDGKESEEKRAAGADDNASVEAKKAAAKALLDQADTIHHATLISQARTVLGRDDIGTKDEAVAALEKTAA